jgi:hypothetical protein
MMGVIYMKKTICAALTVAALLALSACGQANNNGSNTNLSTPETTSTAAADEGTYAFAINGTAIPLGAPADPIVAALGTQTDEPYIAPSCAFEGQDKTYYFAGYNVTTYPLNGADFLYTVTLEDDTVQTPEGLYIGAPEQQIQTFYGGGVTPKNGIYTYQKGKTALEIGAKDGAVDQIIYKYLVEGLHPTQN